MSHRDCLRDSNQLERDEAAIVDTANGARYVVFRLNAEDTAANTPLLDMLIKMGKSAAGVRALNVLYAKEQTDGNRE